MKKNHFALSATVIGCTLMLLSAACQRTDDIFPTTQNAFRGMYQPANAVVQMRHDLHEEGVEASIDSLTFFDRWSWRSDRRLAQVEFDNTGTYYYSNSPRFDNYYYNSNGRLDSICFSLGTDGNYLRTYRFAYSGGLLSRISFPFGQNGNGSRTYTTDFLYRNGEEYPYAIVFTHPLEEYLYNLYHTDTLVKQWTLEWDNGNLVRATADSMAWYTSGLSHIEYFYDNHPNPFQGYFSSQLIGKDGFIDDPTCLCRNNLVRRVDYHYDRRNDSTTSSEHTWNYEYLPSGLPVAFTTVFPTMYWTEITHKCTLTYDSNGGWGEE